MEKELEAMYATLLKGFYEKAQEGNLKDAMRSVAFITSCFEFISANFPLYLEELSGKFPEETNIMRANWEMLRLLFGQMSDSVNINVRAFAAGDGLITDEAHVYLLRSEFVKIIKDMLSCIRTIIKQISIIRQKSSSKPLPAAEYTAQYASAKNKDKTYMANRQIIDRAELKIREYCRDNRPFDRTTKAIIKSGTWEGHLHAHLSDPIGDHRIVYWWYPKEYKVLFERLGTHKELGIG